MPRQNVKLSFGTQMRQLRKQKRMSQETLAHLAGLDRSYVGGVERGERNISLENICLLAKALKVQPSVMLEFSKRHHQWT